MLGSLGCSRYLLAFSVVFNQAAQEQKDALGQASRKQTASSDFSEAQAVFSRQTGILPLGCKGMAPFPLLVLIQGE